jgi:hypothetical protein
MKMTQELRSILSVRFVADCLKSQLRLLVGKFKRHTYCKDCAVKLKSCKICLEKLLDKNLGNDIVASKLILELKVLCKAGKLGCLWIGQL